MKLIKKCRLCRTEGKKLFLKGERCNLSKCSFTRRPYPPGKNKKIRIQLSDYGKQLRSKQEAKRIYGLTEKQLKNYYKHASKTKEATGEILLQLMEGRLDNVVYRLGFGVSRNASRQLVKHGQILINDQKVDIPSFIVKQNDVIKIRDKFQSKIKIKKKQEEIPLWLSINKEKNSGKVLKLPSRKEMVLDINDQLIVEFYSR